LGIHPPSTVSLQVTPPVVPNAMLSQGTKPVTVTVFDDQGTALSGASVELRVNTGTLTMGTACVAQLSCTDTSNVAGQVSATLNAPLVAAGVTTIIVTAEATHALFPNAVSIRTSTVEVHPPGATFFAITLDMPLGDRVNAGQDLPISIGVEDQDQVPVGDASVVITVSAPGLTPNPDGGLGVSQVTLTAASTITTETPFTVTVSVSRGTTSADAERQVTVVPLVENTKLCPDGTRIPVSQQCRTVSTPGLEVLPILAGIGVAALVAGVVAERKRRS
jgi:hypothetical protein